MRGVPQIAACERKELDAYQRAADVADTLGDRIVWPQTFHVREPIRDARGCVVSRDGGPSERAKGPPGLAGLSEESSAQWSRSDVSSEVRITEVHLNERTI
jgi:hypothetical protein